MSKGVKNKFIYESKEKYDIIELAQDGEYRRTFRLNIWNKEYLKKYLKCLMTN